MISRMQPCCPDSQSCGRQFLISKDASGSLIVFVYRYLFATLKGSHFYLSLQKASFMMTRVMKITSKAKIQRLGLASGHEVLLRDGK